MHVTACHCTECNGASAALTQALTGVEKILCWQHADHLAALLHLHATICKLAQCRTDGEVVSQMSMSVIQRIHHNGGDILGVHETQSIYAV